MESFLNGKMKFLKGILYTTIYIVFWEYKHTQSETLELKHWEIPVLGSRDGNVTLATKLAENFTVGTVFTTLKAVSFPDEYLITYASVPDTFRVNNTGQVFVESSAALDYEFVRSYVVAFEARNSKPSTVSMTITIEVEDLNDNAPVFCNNSTTVYIAPGLGKIEGSAVTTVMASDVDGNVNNDLTYAIQEANFGKRVLVFYEQLTNVFRLEAYATYIITGEYERLARGSHRTNKFLVNSADGDCTIVEPRTVETAWSAKVQGQNNNKEHQQAGDDTTAKFAIRQYQGVITTTGVEFERDEYTLVVTAVDGGTPPLTGSTTVIVDMGNCQKGVRPGPAAWIFCVGLILGIKLCILGI